MLLYDAFLNTQTDMHTAIVMSCLQVDIPKLLLPLIVVRRDLKCN